MFKNKKGQAILEAVFVMNIILMLFFGMIMFAVYFYNKSVVLFATNLALDEGIGKLPDPKFKDKNKLEGYMRGKAAGACKSFGLLLIGDPETDCTVTKDAKAGKGKLRSAVRVKMAISLPLISEFVPTDTLQHACEVDYSW